MNKEDKLLYKPQLAPQKDYFSEVRFNGADIPESIQSNNENQEDIQPFKDNEPVASILTDLAELEEVVTVLPSAIKRVILDLVNKLTDHTKKTFPDDKYTEKPKEDIKPKPKLPSWYHDQSSQDYKREDDELPTFEFVDDGIDLIISVPPDISLAVKDNYEKDNIALKNYYIDKMQSQLRSYYQQMVMVMADCGINDIAYLTLKYDPGAINVPDKDYKHLHDHIVRSQIVREQKNRLFQKTHNVDQTMMHFRSWQAAAVQRERYYTAKYNAATAYIELESNLLLENERVQYDKNYRESFYNVYKYFNSSVIVLADMLNMVVNEAKAKGMLINSGINVFETTESLAVKTKDSGNTNADEISAPAGSTDAQDNQEKNNGNGLKHALSVKMN